MLLALAFIKAHWRKFALVGVVILAFVAGKFASPAKVVTEVQERVVEKVVEKKVEVIKEVEVKAAAKVVYIDRVIERDGTVREHVEEREATKTETTRETERTAEREATKEAERKSVTIQESHATARISLLAGVDLSPAWQPIPNGGILALGIHAEFRPITALPLTLGVWGLHTGAFGASAGFEF